MSALMKAAGTGGSAAKLYVDDVFSAYAYTGNGASQTINNGIDIAGKNGLTWIKSRDFAYGHQLFDTVRGAGARLATEMNSKSISAPTLLSAFLSSGFTLGNDAGGNANSAHYMSWTFRRAPKFFDIVTWTGTGSTFRSLNHALGITPGMVIIKRVDAASDWGVWHRADGVTQVTGMSLNGIEAFRTSGGTFVFDASTFNIGYVNSYAGAGNGAEFNVSGANYIAYLFAHDATTDGLIKCGTYNGSNSANVTIDIGFEPQFLLIKNVSAGTDWMMLDTQRSLTIDAGSVSTSPNTYALDAAWNDGYIRLTNRGFTVKPGWSQFSVAGQFVYMAIRRPNKPPTSGTQVYKGLYEFGSASATTRTGVGFAPDSLLAQKATGTNCFPVWYDRLRATGMMTMVGPDAEGPQANGVKSFDSDGVSIGDNVFINPNGNLVTTHFLKRAPGFFDVVCGNFTFGGSYEANVYHSLGVAPELTITKVRSTNSPWGVSSPLGNLALNKFGSTTDVVTELMNGPYDAASTERDVTIRRDYTAYGGHSFVTYLFATLPGVSKVGKYTGNGSSQVVPCGFSNGARFILIKRADLAGDWYTWDSLRGITSGNDPHSSWSSVAPQVTTDDSVAPDSSGFAINQNTATNINVLNGTYIYLAIA